MSKKEYYIVEDGVRVGFFSDEHIEFEEMQNSNELYNDEMRKNQARQNRDIAFRKNFISNPNKANCMIYVSEN